MTLAEFVNKVGFKVDQQSVQNVNNTIGKIKSTATKVLGAIGIGLSLTAVNALVEEFGRVNEQVKNSTAALGDQAEIQKKIMQSARETRSSYAATASVISDLVHESPELFGNINEAVKFNNAATMLFKSAGKTNEEIAGLMEAINKSFAKGYVDSETMSQLLERSPEAVELLNKKLGTTSDKLEEMASSRTMTVADLKAAFVDNADAIEQKFGGVQYRITDALTVVRSQWGLWLSQMDSTLGATNLIARSMVKLSDIALSSMNRIRNGLNWLGDKLGGTDKVLKMLIITVGSFLAVTKADNVIKFLKNAYTQLGLINKVIQSISVSQLKLVAGLIIMALLVEDFINFMQGNDSLLGAMLEKAGVDVDKFRDNIVKVWENIKAALGGIWQGIKNVASSMLGALLDIVRTVFGAMGGVLEKVAPKFAEFLDKLANGDVDVETWKQIGQLIGGLGGIILTVVAGIKIFTGVMKTAKTVIGGVSAAAKAIPAIISMIASPVGTAILIGGALIAVGWLIIKNWDKIKEKATQVWGGIKDFLSNTVSSIRNFFTEAWDNIKNKVVSTAEGIWEKITTVFENIKSGVSEKVGNIKQSIVDGFTAAIDWIKGLPAQAVQWGSDIIQGIVNGIKGAVGKVGDAVSEVAGKIKSFLHFSKPDEGPLSDFDTYMPDMIDMMVKGISAGRGKVRGALEALTSGMSLIANIGTATPATAAATAGGTSVSRSIVQNVNINNKFEGDRAGQQKSAAAMKKASGDTTSELARGLAYVK